MSPELVWLVLIWMLVGVWRWGMRPFRKLPGRPKPAMQPRRDAVHVAAVAAAIAAVELVALWDAGPVVRGEIVGRVFGAGTVFWFGLQAWRWGMKPFREYSDAEESVAASADFQGPQTCGECGLVNPPTAEECDCGNNLK